MKALCTLGMVVAFAGTASAADYFGAGFAIPDSDPTGASSSIVIGDSFSITDLNVTLDINHSWVGDLIITLSNGSTSVELINRPGVPELGSVGYSWNLAGVYTFDDGAATSFESIGNGPGTAFNLPSGSYAPENALAAFNGLDSAGTWTLTISDNAFLDTGTLNSWSLTVVPAPSAVALLGLGGLVAGRRRR